jgi:site-specific recombinase XerD
VTIIFCNQQVKKCLSALITSWKAGRFDGVIIPKEFCFHSLRHCCGSYLVQGGWSLEKTGEYLGQKSIQSTKRYAHFDESNSEEGADMLTKRMYKS